MRASESNRRLRIESEIRSRTSNYRRFGFQRFDGIDDIDFRLNRYKIDHFRSIFDILIDLDRYNVD